MDDSRSIRVSRTVLDDATQAVNEIRGQLQVTLRDVIQFHLLGFVDLTPTQRVRSLRGIAPGHRRRPMRLEFDDLTQLDGNPDGSHKPIGRAAAEHVQDAARAARRARRRFHAQTPPRKKGRR